MRKIVTRTALGLVAAAAAATTLIGSPASAAQLETGVTFYRGTFSAPVLHIAEADGSCRTFPATATSLAALRTVAQVVAYRSTHCASDPVGLGTLRTFRSSEFLSFRAL